MEATTYNQSLNVEPIDDRWKLKKCLFDRSLSLSMTSNAYFCCDDDNNASNSILVCVHADPSPRPAPRPDKPLRTAEPGVRINTNPASVPTTKPTLPRQARRSQPEERVELTAVSEEDDEDDMVLHNEAKVEGKHQRRFRSCEALVARGNRSSIVHFPCWCCCCSPRGRLLATVLSLCSLAHFLSIIVMPKRGTPPPPGTSGRRISPTTQAATTIRNTHDRTTTAAASSNHTTTTSSSWTCLEVAPILLFWKQNVLISWLEFSPSTVPRTHSSTRRLLRSLWAQSAEP